MKHKGERGAIMLEATWCVVLVMFVFLFLMSFGFLLYQRTTVQIVANEVAAELSQTYKYRSVADSSSVTAGDVSGVGKYRYLFRADKFEDSNEVKLKTLTASRLTQTNLAREEGGLTVDVERIADDTGRFHLEVTVEQRYGFLLGDLLEVVGQEDAQTLKSTVYVAGTDVLSYINTIRSWSTLYGLLGSSEIGDTISSVLSIIGNVADLFS